MIVNAPGMAWTGKVVSVQLIDGADNITKATIGCGRGGIHQTVAPTWEVYVGRTVVCFLEGSVLPMTDNMRFMRKYRWTVKKIQVLGVQSNALIMGLDTFCLGGLRPGVDVTDRLGVRKWVANPKPVKHAEHKKRRTIYITEKSAVARTGLAIETALKYGQTEGSEHKMWVIDQMLRALLGDDYSTIISDYSDSGNGIQDVSTWEIGIAP